MRYESEDLTVTMTNVLDENIYIGYRLYKRVDRHIALLFVVYCNRVSWLLFMGLLMD